MYSSCIFCYGDLGRNQELESFPTGWRVAFDPSKGRLWAVCPKCGRWNLSPLEERWESVESAERAYRSGTVRGRSENISLALVGRDLELIRVGQAPPPEVAFWRYGDRFVQQWRRTWSYGALLAAGGVAVVATGSFAALMTLPGGALLLQVPTWLHQRYSERRVVARVEEPDGTLSLMKGKHIGGARLLTHPIDGWALRVEHDRGHEQLRGKPALRVAGPLLTYLNRGGARRKIVDRALQRLEAFPTPDMLYQWIAQKNVPRTGDWVISCLAENSRADLLALEMAAQDELEREALEGELRYLENAWREAEIIASIADDLLVNEQARRWIRTVKGEPALW